MKIQGTTLAVFVMVFGSMPPVEAVELRIGVRSDSAPFASLRSLDTTGQPWVGLASFEGFSVDICRRIADRAETSGWFKGVRAVPVDASDRLARIARRDVDFLCDPTSITVDRLSTCDFSFPYFVTGISYATLGRSATKLVSLADSSIGYVKNTTALPRLRAEWKGRFGKYPKEFGYQTYELAYHALVVREIDAMFGDRDMLEKLLEEPLDEPISLASEPISIETYAFCVEPSQHEVLRVVNETLAALYRSGEIFELIQKHFDGRRPSSVLYQLYGIFAAPDR
ncbi:MAG: transporter substrate-binding domain-containing protein [Alphaproteobacteria bacterium]